MTLDADQGRALDLLAKAGARAVIRIRITDAGRGAVNPKPKSWFDDDIV
jgi:hypothetical protein